MCPILVVPWLPKRDTAAVSIVSINSAAFQMWLEKHAARTCPKLTARTQEWITRLPCNEDTNTLQPRLQRGPLPWSANSSRTAEPWQGQGKGSPGGWTPPPKSLTLSRRACLKRDEKSSVWYNYTHAKVIRKRTEGDRKILASCLRPHNKSIENARLGIQRLTQSLTESQAVALTTR